MLDRFGPQKSSMNSTRCVLQGGHVQQPEGMFPVSCLSDTCYLHSLSCQHTRGWTRYIAEPSPNVLDLPTNNDVKIFNFLVLVQDYGTRDYFLHGSAQHQCFHSLSGSLPQHRYKTQELYLVFQNCAILCFQEPATSWGSKSVQKYKDCQYSNFRQALTR